MSEPRMYPDKLEVKPLERPPVATVRVPGSKSITNRALVLAALSEPENGSHLEGALQSEDTDVMVDALRALGFRVTIEVDGPLVSQPYVAMTVRMMEQFGVPIQSDSATYFHLPVRPWYEGRRYAIEPDASAASYFFAAAAITGGEVSVWNLTAAGL